MYDLVTYNFMTCDDNPPVIVVGFVTQEKGLRATITFVREVREVNIVTCTPKVTKL